MTKPNLPNKENLLDELTDRFTKILSGDYEELTLEETICLIAILAQSDAQDRGAEDFPPASYWLASLAGVFLNTELDLRQRFLEEMARRN